MVIIAEVTLKNVISAALFTAGFFVPFWTFVEIYNYPEEKRSTPAYRLLVAFGKLCGLFWAGVFVWGLFSYGINENKRPHFDEEEPEEPVYWNDRGR